MTLYVVFSSLAVSTACLLLTALVYIFAPDLRDLHGICCIGWLVSQCIVLLIALAFMGSVLAWEDAQEVINNILDNKIVFCIFVITLIYLGLCQLNWRMGALFETWCDARQKTLDKKQCKKKFILTCCGTPVVLLIISGIIFVATKNGLYAILSMLLPVLGVGLFGIFLLFSTIFYLWCSSRRRDIDDIQSIRCKFWLNLSPELLYLVASLLPRFWQLYSAAFGGVYIFLVYVVLRKRVRLAVGHWLCKTPSYANEPTLLESLDESGRLGYV